jgi:glutamate---cysteine ligase / carboxylate-amine ligase
MPGMKITPKMIEPDFTLGIEEEYLLVDRSTRDLVAEHPDRLFADCEAALGEQVSREYLRCQIEVGTRVHATARAAGEELRRLRTVVVQTAANYNLAPIAASTHPFARWNDQQPTERPRYQSIAKDLAGVGTRLVVNGMHVHVGLGENELRMDLMNQVRYFLPHLLTLSTSSPFREGEDSGMKCYRLAAYRELPRTGMPGRFESWDEYRRNVDVLIESGVIEDGTKIWWDIRPSCRYPTLEMRVTDVCTKIEDAVAVAALYVCILRMLWRLRRNNQRWRTYPVFLLEENRWRAMRYGVNGTLFDLGKGTLVPFPQLLDEILERVAEDAAALGCECEVAHTRTIVARGTSADRQVAVFEAAKSAGASPHEALRKVVDHLVAETRII